MQNPVIADFELPIECLCFPEPIDTVSVIAMMIEIGCVLDRTERESSLIIYFDQGDSVMTLRAEPCPR